MISQLDRYRQIAEILSRNGLGFLVSALGLEGRLPFRKHQAPKPAGRPKTRPQYLRAALEELGPTYVKIGQLLSTRPDLLPPDYQRELAKLQDNADPVPWPQIVEELRQELGGDPLEVFGSFDTTVMASASIGQVYAATLKDGTEVVVKVRRPGVVSQVEQDLEILQNLANAAGKRWEAARDYDLPGLMDEFAATLRTELDYLQEGRNADRFRANFEDDPAIDIPAVYWEHSTSRVLTLGRIRGLKVTDVAALDAAGIDRPALAVAASRVEMKMVFDDGFFHADPHPGNLFVEPGGRVGLIDFGMVGEVDEKLRSQLSALFIGIMRKDPERMTNALVRINASGRRVNRVKLSMDLGPLIRLYSGKDLGSVPVGSIITTGLGILRTHHIQLPREMALLLRMLILTEGMGEVLDPQFRLGPTLGPYARRMALQQLNPVNYARRLGRAGTEVLELSTELPDQVRRLMNTLDVEGMEVHIRAEELFPLVIRLERVGNRMVAAIFASAFIRGVGELTLGDSSRWKSWQAPLMSAGLAATGALGGYIAWTSRRARLRGT
ncbi:ABC1 kinase family protein [Arthrobacter yangruifuii]|uniref:ABC1 kinase family protein n=1 Tax=Arthrobacter yangruifuii TaxID=2606616 RepID=UPI0011B7E148|nr:AarF/ABC1/UbiB kinase family protein [Arthrobacter yangruifuii]